jgi:pyruvate dehydrogenase E2 component (dihydrolipoamide acetyltransferase)
MADIIEMPKLGFDMAEGTLVNWVKAEGEKIAKGEVIAEIETDKATVQVDSAYSGVVFKHLVAASSKVPVGTPIAIVAAEGEKVNLDELLKLKTVAPKPSQPSPAPEETKASIPGQTKVEENKEASEFTKASPIAKSMAEEAGIDISKVTGSGPEGRVVKRDIEDFLHKQPVGAAPKSTIQAVGEDIPQEMSRLRVIIGKRMLESKQSIPHFYVTHSFDVANLQAMREQMNQGVDEEARITFNDLIVKSAALTLRQFGALNSSISGNQIIPHNHINIGIAVGVENGLITVVCRDADQKKINEISQEIKMMSRHAREGKVRTEDIEGSTFTISNLGMYEVEDFAAIINPPEAAILAVCSIQELPVVKNGMIIPGKRMKMTLSADHRVTDGVEAAKFMQALALYIEQPWRLVG